MNDKESFKLLLFFLFVCIILFKLIDWQYDKEVTSGANTTATKTGTTLTATKPAVTKPALTTPGATTSEVTAPAETTPETTTPVETTPAVTTPVEEIIRISAGDLVAAFTSNEIKANFLYKGKTIEVTGIVKNVSEVSNTVTVTMGASKDSEWTLIRARFKDKSENVKIAELNVGEETTIIGKCDGLAIDVEVEDCKMK